MYIAISERHDSVIDFAGGAVANNDMKVWGKKIATERKQQDRRQLTHQHESHCNVFDVHGEKYSFRSGFWFVSSSHHTRTRVGTNSDSCALSQQAFRAAQL